jgi:hypothetical protein
MKIDAPSGHLDQLLRQTRAHHVQLSTMADHKASMLLTVSMIVITFISPRATDPMLRWPALILCASSLATVILAAIAVMPKIHLPGLGGGKVDPDGRFFNILFFGDFANLSLDEYESRMTKVLNDSDASYEVMIREIYTMGVFLARQKYRYIRLAFSVFIVGLIASGIALAWSLQQA